MITYEMYYRVKRLFFCKIWAFIWGRNFNFFGKKVYMYKPQKLQGLRFIHIEDNVYISEGAWLEVLEQAGEAEGLLTIKNGSYIGRSSHIIAKNHIEIGKKVLIADKVYISDNIHQFNDVSLPIMNQPVVSSGKVSLGDGCWIGENVSIIGASVGKNSVVAANAVVTKDIPEYSVAVGIPAKVIKEYCFKDQIWKSVK